MQNMPILLRACIILMKIIPASGCSRMEHHTATTLFSLFSSPTKKLGMHAVIGYIQVSGSTCRH